MYINESKTCEILANCLEKVINEFEIYQNKTVAIMTDSEANMFGAIKRFKNEMLILCTVHRLNFCLNDIF